MHQWILPQLTKMAVTMPATSAATNVGHGISTTSVAAATTAVSGGSGSRDGDGQVAQGPNRQPQQTRGAA